jgi:hypothetical protein
MAGMITIITLAFMLATAILLVILSCALDNNWLPLLVVLTYVLAPIPNRIAKAMSQRDYGEIHGGNLEIGYFFTSIFITTGFGIPLVLNHAEVITNHAMIMSIIGGLLIYSTILGYMFFFTEQVEDY